MAERVLTQRELNRALLARQLLLARVRLPLPRALERIGGIQNQYAPNGYLGLWTRLDGFERDALTRALQRRTVIQATSLRGTIHLLSARDFWPFAAGARRARQAWWASVHRRHENAVDLDAAVAATRALLRGTTRSGDDLARLHARFAPAGAPRHLVGEGVSTRLELVRVPPAGTWERRRAHTFALAEEWLPGEASEEDGLELLARRYLGAFGPAPVADLARWAGVPAAAFAPTLARLRLRRFRDESGGELLDLPRAPLPHPETPAPVRFLPTFDATLLAHARRTGIILEADRARIFHVRAPQSFPTFLVDGAVAGTWRYEAGRIRIEPFGRLARQVRRELDDEAERLAAFHA